MYIKNKIRVIISLTNDAEIVSPRHFDSLSDAGKYADNINSRIMELGLPVSFTAIKFKQESI